MPTPRSQTNVRLTPRDLSNIATISAAIATPHLAPPTASDAMRAALATAAAIVTTTGTLPAISAGAAA